jgi:uncharacterized damage-inducible protein DinB
MADQFLENKLQQIEKAVDTTINAFSQLNVEQLNYKTDPKSWSIAQCLDHLVISDKQYTSIIKRMAAGTYEPTFWAKMGIGAKFFGRFLIKTTTAIPEKKVKTLSSFEPSKSDLPADIVEKYQAHDKEWRAILSQLDGIDYANTRLSSPAGAAITYNLEDLLTLLANHKERHYHQAMAVMQSEGFPK